MNTMHKGQKAMNMICEQLGVENFYSVNFTKTGVTLQGEYSPEVAQKLEGFEMFMDRNGFINFHKSEDGYVICIAFTR
jgi:hypothetical protein